jgi:hypothetical protein
MQICTQIRRVRDLFEANYVSYSNNYRTAFSDTCDQTKGPDPATLDESAMLAHVYGWGPFNANCTAETNLLEDTPGYQENNNFQYQSVKSDFDSLNKMGEFNPYVKLIHDPEYLNAQYVYAYSVDDAVGNMQTKGEGLIIAIGGTNGLPNSNPATSPIHVSFGYGPNDAVKFVKYGACTDTPDQDVNPNFASFDLSANQLSNCTLSFLDNQNPPSQYFFKITKQPPYPSRPPDGQPIPAENKTMIDCSGNAPSIVTTWCENIFGFTEAVVGQHTSEDDHISVAAPAQPPQAHPPLTKVSIAIDSLSRNGTLVEVHLAIHNSGATGFTSMQISKIGLHTLAGAGDARLVDPLPIHIDKLAPGAATTIALQLAIPHNVNKLVLTESGAVDTSESSPYRFSLGQVIFLKQLQ